ncbi:MmpS family transport accessory protein [Mycobacterium sp. ITM-2016-00317]|uniref:MmpS family transport accessory protein n=1 Tax=Mycobacterium sp. ITM-2016-00317 TaxID=2099694 RepID=UPI00287FB7E7|nr:MmpS family transport accessory protein [Mycobacterium sp. ITM-2016-00317]WNG85948.1 MmpS family transport accessory protein [Mycobacterium sp. ITM-2016-00317]
MTESPWDRGREERSGRGGREERYPSYPGYSDPAYASQAPYGQPYQPPSAPQPTERLPAYSPYGYDPYATGQYPPQPPHSPGGEPPKDPKPPRWLWVVAGVAVLLVIGLVIALVIVKSSEQQTVVAPLPAAPEPSFTTQTPTTTSRTPTTRPSTPVLPAPTRPSTSPTEPTVPGATDAVVYTVAGTGRAINITYVDTGGLLQTEFNVMLPWSKEVALPQPAEESASISIINVGREVTCSITVDGAQLDQRTGAGLTICTPRR